MSDILERLKYLGNINCSAVIRREEINAAAAEIARLRERVRVLEEAARAAVPWMWEQIESTEKKTGKRMDFLREIAVKTDKALAWPITAAKAMEDKCPPTT